MVIGLVSFNLQKLMKRLYRLLFLLSLAGTAFAGWKYRDPIISFYRQHIASEDSEKKDVPDPARYQELITELEQKRQALADRYARARTAQDFSSAISESRTTLEATLPEMMSCWLGTPWDFHGTCETPGSGKIACGYFVSTILRDAGFQVERFRLAQQPSQGIIATFLPKEEMHIRASLDYDTFLDQVTARGPGIRIVGLDSHVAFLIVPESGDLRFIHSSGAASKCVVDENRKNAGVLRKSNYRVTGNLTDNDEVIYRWLFGEKWPTKL